jgi:phosphate transport system permease protein
MIELLTGIPSVVFGLVGLSVIVPWVRSWGGGTGYGILAGSIVLAVMILPTITSLATDAIEAVPDAYRDGSYGLGCTRWQTIVHVVLPSALPGILTAVIMGMTRAFGEALAVQMVVGNAAQMPRGLLTPASTLTSVLTMGMGNEAMGTVYNDVLWSLALVLLLMSLVFILIVHLIGEKGASKHD